MRVTNHIPLGSPPLLSLPSQNHVETLKVVLAGEYELFVSDGSAAGETKLTRGLSVLA
jgi:hypothetical protein